MGKSRNRVIEYGKKYHQLGRPDELDYSADHYRYVSMYRYIVLPSPRLISCEPVNVETESRNFSALKASVFTDGDKTIFPVPILAPF